MEKRESQKLVAYGKAKKYGVPTITKEQIYLLPKKSYARFLRKLPKLIGSKFPVEIKKNGHTYRMEAENLRVKKGDGKDWFCSATYKGDPTDEVAAIGHCMSKKETLSHALWGTFRVYKDSHLVSKLDRHMMDIPALTSYASMILSGRDMALKTEQSLDGTSFRNYGEVLEDLFANCDLRMALRSDLPEIADAYKDKKTGVTATLANYVFRTYMKVNPELMKNTTLLPVNGQNPCAMLKSITGIRHLEPESREDDPGTPETNRGPAEPWSVLKESVTGKREGAKFSTEGLLDFLIEIVHDDDDDDGDGELACPMHPVVNGVVQEEVELVKINSLPPTMNFMPIGTKVSEDETVLVSKIVPLDEDREKIESDVVSFKDLGEKKTAYVPVSPYQFQNVSEIFLVMFGLNNNPQREAFGLNHGAQAQSAQGREPSRIITYNQESERALVEATNAALFAEGGGKVVKVDKHEIVIADGEEMKTYHLDAVMTRNSTTDQRYTPLVQQGDIVKPGDVIADGPFTRDGIPAMGVDAICAYIPFTAIQSVVDGVVLDGPRDGGSNNNDSIIITEDLAEKMKVHEMVTVSYTIPSGTVLEDNGGDGRFDSRGILKEGTVVSEDDIMLDKRILKAQEDVQVMDILADENNNVGRKRKIEKLNKKITDGVIEKVEVNNGKVTYHIGYDRPLRPGDKITKSGQIGDKFTVSAIVPVGGLGSFTGPDGKEIYIQAVLDTISHAKRGVNPTIDQIYLCLKVLKERALISPDENDIIGIHLELSKKAGLNLDKTPWNPPKDIDEEYLPAYHAYRRILVGAMNLLVNEHKAVTGRGDESAQDRMGGSGTETLDEVIKEQVYDENRKVSSEELATATLTKTGVNVHKSVFNGRRVSVQTGDFYSRHR